MTRFRYVLLVAAILGCGSSKVDQRRDSGVEERGAFDVAADVLVDLSIDEATNAAPDAGLDVAHDAGPDIIPDVTFDIARDTAASDGPFDAAIEPASTTDAAEETRADGGAEAGLQVCPATPSTGEPGCALGADLMPVMAAVSAAVTVVSIADVATDACAGLTAPSPAGMSSGGGPAKRLVVRSATQQQWTIDARIPGLPADIAKAGDQLDLAVDARPSTLFGGVDQTVVLARNGRLVLFTSSRSHFSAAALPNLDAHGIVVKGDGVTCEVVVGITCCRFRGRRAVVSLGGQSATVTTGQTVAIGKLSFTVDSFFEPAPLQCCDGRLPVKMAGFMAGP